jgi:hypothetical protein
VTAPPGHEMLPVTFGQHVTYRSSVPNPDEDWPTRLVFQLPEINPDGAVGDASWLRGRERR